MTNALNAWAQEHDLRLYSPPFVPFLLFALPPLPPIEGLGK
jgi:hypothetical protein